MMDFNINKLEISNFKFPEILLPSLFTVREIIFGLFGSSETSPSSEFLFYIF